MKFAALPVLTLLLLVVGYPSAPAAGEHVPFSLTPAPRLPPLGTYHGYRLTPQRFELGPPLIFHHDPWIRRGNGTVSVYTPPPDYPEYHFVIPGRPRFPGYNVPRDIPGPYPHPPDGIIHR